MASSSSVNISTAGSAESTVNVSPQSITVQSGSSVNFSNNNSGTSPDSIRITFPANVICKVKGRAVSSLSVPVNGSVAATIEGGQSEGPYTVASTWGDDVVTASPVIIVE